MTITTTIALADCPVWCADHAEDEFGVLIGHVSDLLFGEGPEDERQVYLDVRSNAGRPPYVCLSADAADMTPTEAGRLGIALLRAADLAEPGTFVRTLVEAMEEARR